jgi:hypothetical protein
VGYQHDLNLYAYVKNNLVSFTDPARMITTPGSSTSYPSTAAANVSVQAPISAPKLDTPMVSMPTVAVTNEPAI